VCNRLVGTVSRITSTHPVLQEIGRIGRIIVGGVQKFLELALGDRISIHVEGLDFHFIR
jgi:hypothetical protein